MTIENGRPGPPVTSPSIILLTLARRIEAELNAALASLDIYNLLWAVVVVLMIVRPGAYP